MVVYAGGLASVLLVAYLLLGVGISGPKRTAATRIENALLTDANRDLGAAGTAADLRDMRRRMREIEGENEKLRRAFDRTDAQGNVGADARVQAELGELRRMLTELQTNPRTPESQRAGGSPTDATAPPSSPSRPVGTQPVGVGVIDGGASPPPPPAYGAIRSITHDAKPEVAPSVTQSVAKAIPAFYLPTGSMISGVLLAGVDAPTGRGALKDPIPVLARIKREAILPNRYRADVRECFALLESSGDLASERAMMRLTNISCVRRDKTVIDVPIAGYAVGEDGRAGLRGRLVSKQGQVLAKAMMAGFAEGISSAFGGDRQMGLGGNLDDIQYGSVPEKGALRGASSALDRIAAYYLDLADQLHPTVEIDAGRQVTIILLKGRELASLNSQGATKPGGQPTATRNRN
jgi:conjugal transfer pilus assembly protein TraB